MTPPLLLLSVSHARYAHTCITCTCTTCTVCTRRCTRPCKGVSVNQTGTSFSNPPWGDPTPAGFPLCGAPAAPGVTRAPAAGSPPLSPPPLPPPCAHAQAQRPLWATGTSLQGKTRFLLLVPARALPGAWQTLLPRRPLHTLLLRHRQKSLSSEPTEPYRSCRCQVHLSVLEHRTEPLPPPASSPKSRAAATAGAVFTKLHP